MIIGRFDPYLLQILAMNFYLNSNILRKMEWFFDE
jgi:hypothetical protein